MAFSGGHVFTYSSRPGTAAAHMPDQVPHAIRKERNGQLRDLLAEGARDYQRKFLHQTLQVLWESAVAIGPEYWHLSGLSDNYLRVNVQAPRHLWNQITPVRIKNFNKEQLEGELLKGV